jgi:hypothetical protein
MLRQAVSRALFDVVRTGDVQMKKSMPASRGNRGSITVAAGCRLPGDAHVGVRARSVSSAIAAITRPLDLVRASVEIPAEGLWTSPVVR